MAKFRYLQQTRTFETKAGLRIKIDYDMFVLQRTQVHINPCLLPHSQSHRLATKSCLLNTSCKSIAELDMLLLLRWVVPVRQVEPTGSFSYRFFFNLSL